MGGCRRAQADAQVSCPPSTWKREPKSALEFLLSIIRQSFALGRQQNSSGITIKVFRLLGISPWRRSMSKLSEIIARNEDQIRKDWLAGMTKSVQRADLMSKAEVEEQSGALLAAIAHGAKADESAELRDPLPAIQPASSRPSQLKLVPRRAGHVEQPDRRHIGGVH